MWFGLKAFFPYTQAGKTVEWWLPLIYLQLLSHHELPRVTQYVCLAALFQNSPHVWETLAQAGLSKCIEVCNPYLNFDVEHFHHRKNFSHVHLQSLPTPTSAQGIIDLQFLQSCLFWIFHTNAIIQYVGFCKTSFIFICVTTCSSSLFLLMVK